MEVKLYLLLRTENEAATLRRISDAQTAAPLHYYYIYSILRYSTIYYSTCAYGCVCDMESPCSCMCIGG